VLTYLFDKPKAMEALFALEQSWGGTIAERMKREAEQWAANEPARKRAAAQQAAADRRRRHPRHEHDDPPRPVHPASLDADRGRAGDRHFRRDVLVLGGGRSVMPWALPHFVRFAVFLGMAVVMSLIKPDTYRDFSWPAYGAVIVLLIVTLVIGTVGGGAKSWLELGFIRIQPSELMKPVTVLLIAGFYGSLPPGEIRKFGAVWPPIAILAIPSR
jgi:hypothetical protein